MAAHRLASGQHEVRYILGLDDDDVATTEALEALVVPKGGVFEFDALITRGPSPGVRGEVENRMLAVTMDAPRPDVVTLMSDRTFTISPRWDSMIAAAVTKCTNQVLWWSCPEDNGCVIPIIPRAYLDAIDWKWSAEIFPFWWEDTWHQEINMMLFGLPSLKVKAFYAGSRGRTRNAREFAFWLDVFRATRPMRREIAAKVAAALKVQLAPRPDVEQYFERYDTVMLERCPMFQESFGDLAEPDANYVAAKARAEVLLQKPEAA